MTEFDTFSDSGGRRRFFFVGLLWSAAGFLGGIVVASLASESLVWLDEATVLAVGVVLAFGHLFLVLVGPVQDRKIFLIAGLVVLFGSLGWFHFCQFEVTDSVLDQKVGQEIEFSGRVTSEPELRGDRKHLVVSPSFSEAKVLVLASGYLSVEYQDRVDVRGWLSRPKPFKTDHGRYFDYPSYLAVSGIGYQMFYAEVEVTDRASEFSVRSSLWRIKEDFLSSLGRLFPEPHGAFLGGLLVGARRAMGDDLLEAFRRTGIIHIVVLSGYNVSLVAATIVWLLQVFPSWLRSVLAGLAIAGFALMVGSGPTVVRASIMATLAVLAQATGRRYTAFWGLIVAGLIMVYFNPRLLVFDLGFQLSFLATLGLILFVPYLESVLGFLPEVFRLKTIAAMTLSAQIMVLPWIAYSIGEWSLVAPLVNVLVLPVIPLTMLGGFLSGVLGLVIGVLAWPVAVLTYGLLNYQLLIVEHISSWPLAAVEVPPFSGWLVAGGYLGILYFWWQKVKV